VWRGRHVHVAPSPLKNGMVGAAAGVSSTLAHAAGPIIALYLLPQRLERQLFVGTCAVYFFLVNTAKLPGYYATGLFTQLSPTTSLRFLPLVLLGAFAGRHLNHRIPDRPFTRAVYAITFALGLYILIRGLETLARP